MKVNLTIDQRPLAVEAGTTILEAARRHGIEIPTLCDYPGLPSHGSCRLCIVEIEGRQNLPTACTTPVEEGMVVQTRTSRVQALRADLVQMLCAEHPAACLFCDERANCQECMITLRKASVTTGCRSCPKDGQCRLQELVAEFGLERPAYPVRYRMLPVEKNDPFFDRDYNLCVLCGRCVRACKELHFSAAIDFTRRGVDALVGTAFERSHLEAGCSFCGACVELCPTGALSEKTRKWDGKPEREQETSCPLCNLACGMTLLAKKDRVIGSLPDHSRSPGELCVNGRFGITELVNHPSRLKEPQKAEAGTVLSLSWEEAFALATEKLAACPPEKFRMRLSPSLSNEDLYVAQKFAREALGAEDVRTALPACYESEPGEIFKHALNSASLDSLQTAAVVACVGLEGRYAQSVVEMALHRARERGAGLLSIYPGPHTLGRFADVSLQPEPGEEAALLEELGARLAGAGSEARLEHAARLLERPGEKVIVLGPALFNQAQAGRALRAVEHLAARLGARVVAAGLPGNLAGAYWMGAFPELLPGGAAAPVGARAHTNGRPAGVLYLIGEQIPASGAAGEFVIQQHIYPSAGEAQAGLTLPCAAFSEAEGTLVDYTGRVRPLRAAAPPPGMALPGWQILSGIARRLGKAGFDYRSVEEVRAEIAARVPGFESGGPLRLQAQDLPLLQPSARDCEAAWEAAWASPAGAYLGFPLEAWVAGLRDLHPVKRSEGSRESHV